jgi:hypothetical protein
VQDGSNIIGAGNHDGRIFFSIFFWKIDRDLTEDKEYWPRPISRRIEASCGRPRPDKAGQGQPPGSGRQGLQMGLQIPRGDGAIPIPIPIPIPRGDRAGGSDPGRSGLLEAGAIQGGADLPRRGRRTPDAGSTRCGPPDQIEARAIEAAGGSCGSSGVGLQRPRDPSRAAVSCQIRGSTKTNQPARRSGAATGRRPRPR